MSFKIAAFGLTQVPQKWREVEVLRTSRKEVERLLGSPRVLGGVSMYDFNDMRVEIFYQRRSCSTDPQGWNVPIGTVIGVDVVPKKKFAVSEMQLDMSKFKREPGAYDQPTHAFLRNDEEGFTISVFDEMVDSYSYGPKKRDKHKRCPGYSIAEEQRLRDCEPAIFRVECSALKIDANTPVMCSARFDEIASNVSPKVTWSVSKNAKFVTQGDKTRVSLISTKSRTVSVTGRVTEPNICTNVAAEKLQVIRKKKKHTR
ncbi:MAG: hypothetical protein WAQ99_22045 [Pyrinomonadaceae bacterium]